jgi:hypothetical protein
MRRRSLTGALPLLCCLNHFSSASSTSLCSGFRKRFILDPFCSNALIIMVLLFQIVWIVEFTIRSSLHASFSSSSSRPLPPRFYFFNHFNFFFEAQNLLVNVSMLLLCQSPVNCRSRKVEGNFMHIVYRYCCHFTGLELVNLPELRALSSQGQGNG